MRGLAAFGVGAVLFSVQSGVAQMSAPDTPLPRGGCILDTVRTPL